MSSNIDLGTQEVIIFSRIHLHFWFSFLNRIGDFKKVAHAYKDNLIKISKSQEKKTQKKFNNLLNKENEKMAKNLKIA
jgi:hypothetical protein